MTTPRPERPKLKHRKQLTAAAAQRSSAADLRKQLDQRTRELAEAQKIVAEALQRQTATAQVLKIISRSTFDLQTVFQTLVESAALMCEADLANIWRPRGTSYHLAASFGIPGKERAREANKEYLESIGIEPGRGSIVGRALLEKRPVQVYDVQADPDYLLSGIVSIGDYRTLLGVPLLREGEPIGVFALTRCIVKPFTDKQIELVSTFADQAVIAIENTRLFEEVRTKTRDLQEALVHQTGSANILKVIASSPTDVKPVLEAIVESACELCNADDAVVHLREGEDLRYGAHHGTLPVGFERHAISRDFVAGRSVVDKIPVHIHDVPSGEGDDFPEAQRMSRQTGLRTILSAPMLRESECIGAIVLRRKEVHPFSDKQVALLESFADQAVIAIENVRLFDEVQAKTRDLEESLQQQTATSEVLQIISSSPGDLAPVFDKMLESATRVCGAEFGSMVLVEDDSVRQAALYNAPPAFAAARTNRVFRPHPLGQMAAAIRTKQAVQEADVRTSPAYLERLPHMIELAELGGARTLAIVPMLREDEVIGAITIYRQEVRPFADKQIELVSNFAKQAVIAIENARLLRELHQRTADLTESLQQQIATADVLEVIASSPTDVKPVLKAIVESACELCEANDALVVLKDGDDLAFQAQHGSIPIAYERRPIDRQWITGRAVVDCKPVHVHDLLAPEGEEFPGARELASRDSTRTVLAVPLLREGESIGAIVLRRAEVCPFSDKQIALLQTFSNQAVIAIGNVRLFDEVQVRTRDLSESLRQQTATADVLKVISRSAFDLPAVLQTLVESVTRLAAADEAMITRKKDGVFYRAESYGFSQEFMDYIRTVPVVPERGSAIGRALLEGVVVHIPDVEADLEYTFDAAQQLGISTLLAVPMLREGVPAGVILLTRRQPRAFTDKQIELATTFADQAAIAIENVRLFEQVQARTRELAASLEDLRAAQDRLVQTQKLASLGQLTAGIAHEIKNPLNFVNNFSALSVELADELGELLKSAALGDKIRAEIEELTALLKDNLGKVIQHGKRADSIVKNMLLHSREGSGEHRPADINALVDESLNLAYHGARAEKAGFHITFQRDFDPATGTVDVYPQEITRVLLNLISNGFYAATKRAAEMGDGFEPTLKAATKNLGDKVEIRIWDNGAGIPPGIKEKIFNPFFTTKPAGEGTGLGLSMSHDIVVKQHGGKIDVDTKPDAFTEFIVTLPRTTAEKK
jgi:GAF domain-containing protein